MTAKAARKGVHKVFRDAETGQYVHREYAAENPQTTVAEVVSGELRKVTMTNLTPIPATDDNPVGVAKHTAEDYVPVEHLDAYMADARQRWALVEAGDEHDSGPGGDDQHFHEEN